MTKINIKSLIGLALIGIFLALAVDSAFADKPISPGNGKNKEAKGNKVEKKSSGCQPPGQAKKWKKGYPLRDKYYDLPDELVIRLPVPPLNHRYVRVAGDILLIAIGTSMVVDAM